MPHAARRRPRFYTVSPASDRRGEQRYESREDVVIRFPQWGTVRPGAASDIGRMGLRLECADEPGVGDRIDIAFPATSDHVRAFGRIVWTRRNASTKMFEAGVQVESWNGIVLGDNSWLRFKGAVPKRDRRANPR